MSTYDNSLYGPRARGELTPQTLEFAEFLLNKVGLREFRKKNIRRSYQVACSAASSWHVP